jgi:hypothetical protein
MRAFLFPDADAIIFFRKESCASKGVSETADTVGTMKLKTVNATNTVAYIRENLFFISLFR